MERLRAHLTATAVCAQMGTSRTTLWVLERAARVSSEQATAYRAAVKTLADAKEGAA
jgi:hypothetical protein